MSKTRLYAEVFVQIVIAYSLVTYFVELEAFGGDDTQQQHPFFLWSERVIAGIFSVEYLARWWSSRKKLLYPFRVMAIIDLLAILPFYLGFLVDLRALRLIRTLRILRIFKVYRYSAALRNLLTSYRKVKDELYVLGAAMVLVMFLSGTIVYEAEREAQPEKFTKYSDGLWWGIVTLTTVGYGDLFPVTVTGRITATVTMLVGLGVFGSFVWLIGGAFVSTIREQRRSKGIRIAPETAERVVQILESTGRSVDEEEANRLIDEALEQMSIEQLQGSR